MRDKVKRFISILMTALMLVNLLPVGALAEGFTISNSVQSIGWWDGYPVFVFVKVEGDTTGLTMNSDHWFTLGMVESMPGVTKPPQYVSGYQDKINGVTADQVKNRMTRYKPNKSINLDGITWMGFKSDRGASDTYDQYKNQYCWHLDGSINIEELKVNYTIRYVDENNNKEIASSKTKTGKAGSFTEVEREDIKDITGYTYTGYYDPMQKLIGGKDTVINVYYRPNSYSYRVEHYYDGEIDNSKTDTIHALYGSEVDKNTLTLKPKNGYEFEKTENCPLTIGTDESKNVIKVYYKKKADLSYTVKYLEKGTNKKLHNEKTVENQTFGAEITSASEKIDIDGYNYDSVEPEEKLTIGTGENVITFYYTKRTDLSYTVKYLEKGTNKKLHNEKTVENQTFGAEITSASEKIDIDGYNYDSVEPEEKLTIGTGENVITFYYTKRNDLSYTVNYIDKDTGKAIINAKTVENQTFGAVIESEKEKIEIDGYNYDSVDKEKLTIGTGKNAITFYYTKRNDLSYTVNYLEKDTEKVLHDAKVQGGMTFEDVVTSADEVIDIDGYNYDSVDKDTLTIGTSDNVINIYYTKKTGLSYTVNYLEKDTEKVLHDAKVQGGMTFEDVVTSADEVIDIDGYNYDSVDKDTLTIGTSDNVINIYYTKKTGLSYTVNYLEKDTEKVLHDAKVQGGMTFEDVVTSADEVIDIDGYNYDSADKETLTIGTGENVINLYYTKQTNLSYKVNYLEQGTTNVLHEQKVQGEMTFDDVVKSEDEVIEINGYNYASADKETLTIGTGENVINLYYTKQTNLSYKVNYLEQGTTNVLHEQKVQGEMTFDDVVKSEDEVIEINGYNYASADKETLTIGTGENVINLYYTKQTNLSYTVNYYWNGTTEKVADSKTEENQTFEDVIIEAPKLIDGYTPISLERQELTITTDDNDNTITFYYYKNVKLTANSATLPYNGEDQSVSGYTCAVEEKQQDGSVEYVPWTGEKPLTFEGVSASGSGKDVNKNGYPVTFNDTPIGKNDGLYYVNESQTGTLTITPRSVTLTSETASKTYDGTPLTRPNVTVSTGENEGFVEGEVTEIKATGSVTNAGSVANTITFTPNKETFKDGNYAITKTEGTLTIAKRSVLITSQSATKTYDGSALTRPAVTITGDGFVPGELAKAEATGSITYVGSTPNTIQYTTTGAFNAANYSIALSVGTLTVTEKPKPEPRRTFNLTINYVYQNGKRAAASYNRGGLKNGETFDITSPVIAGYTASETVVSGTIYNRDIKVTVIYTADGVNLDDYGVPLGLGNITMNVGDCFE